MNDISSTFYLSSFIAKLTKQANKQTTTHQNKKLPNTFRLGLRMNKMVLAFVLRIVSQDKVSINGQQLTPVAQPDTSVIIVSPLLLVA